MIKHALTIILYNFIHILAFFFIPFQIVFQIISPENAFDYFFFFFVLSVWSFAQTIFYAHGLKKFFPKTYETVLKELENV